MGTWDYRLNENDSFQDIYWNFFEHYNAGRDPIEISRQIKKNFSEMFLDSEDGNNCLFALALAQWETKSLETSIFDQIKEIIESESDLQVWRGLGADDRTLKKRKEVLEKFLLRISIERQKPKRRVRRKIDYQFKKLLELPAPDGKKTFEIIETYEKGEYQDTSSMLFWASGGGSIFYFYNKGKFVTARWLDSQTLEIRHDKTIDFGKKEERFFFWGDSGVVTYIAE